MEDKLIFEKSHEGRTGCALPQLDVPEKKISDLLPGSALRTTEPMLPEVGEVEIVRHFVNLSHKNIGVDTNFYPLGSCTMKYNPKINETLAALPGMLKMHPYQPEDLSQGMLELMYLLGEYLKEISGLPAISLQPAAGAHGELAGVLMMRAYHLDRGEHRTKMLIPDSAHGTNPASTAICGFHPVEIKSDERGNVDLDDLREKCDEETVGLMLTIPSTLGLFDERLPEIARILHEKGALLYMDGANLNAIMGIVDCGRAGVDVMHFNLHKTFSTPHGMGGPGSGPVAVAAHLADFLPVPLLAKDGKKFSLDYGVPKTIGRVKTFYGNVGVCVKAFCYILSLGAEGVRRVSEVAVLNANYLMEKLKKHYFLKYDRRCMHEFVLSGRRQLKEHGVRTLDISKRLLDLGFHPPTNYFPLIVDEALMIEPTENESVETLDAFADALIQIAREAKENPELVKSAPQDMPVKRLDDVRATKQPILRYRPE
jgi:glycine dehydrogenase subunit 2